MKLTHRPKSHTIYKGRRYKVNLQFDNVLRIFALQREKELARTDKIDLTAELLLGRTKLNIWDKAQIIEQVFKTEVSQGRGGAKQKSFDFTQDAGSIYASFWQAYKIDLHTADLHWEQFMALFEGLPQDTAIKEIISIRLKPIPKATKHNGEEIKALMEAKALYALTYDKDEARQSFQHDLERFAAMVKGK